MRQLTTLSLFLFLLLNLASTNVFSKEKNPSFIEEGSATINNLFAVLDPMEPSCATCADGSIMSAVAGGVAPYNYNWSTGANTSTITNLAVGTYFLTVSDQLGCVQIDSINLAFSGSNVTLTLNVATLATTCFGSADGNAVAVADGGIMPYTYSWSTGDTLNTASNLMAGTYTATVTDAIGISAVDTFEIIEPSQLTVATNTITGCDGPNSGEAIAIVNGGVFPYSYAWSTGDSTAMIFGLSTGTFGVTVTDANGCVAEFSDVLIQPIALNVNPEPTAPSCFANSDGFINASVWGGTEPYTYLWSDGQTVQTAINLIPSNYSVTVTDNLGCSVIGNVVLDGGNPIDVTVQGISTVSCVGSTDGALLVNAFGGSGNNYTYQWANGDTGAFADSLASGYHTLTITDDSGCTHIDSVFVNSPLALNVFLNPIQTCGGVNAGVIEAVPTGGTLPYTYMWDTGATTQIIDGLPVGDYAVTVTDINGCTTMAATQVTEIPNAFSGDITTTAITCTNGDDGTAMAIPDGGAAPYTYAWSNGSTGASITGLTVGSYTVTITDTNGCNVVIAASMTVPSPVIANETVVNAEGCNGSVTGSITLNPVGGTAPYAYLWSTGSAESFIDGLSAGTYTVDVVDANNCVQTFSYNVGGGGTDNPPVVLTQDVAVALDANGMGIITVNDIDAGTTDDCGLASVVIDQMIFDCSHIGNQTVTLTATDMAGQISIGTAIVTIVDTLLPTVITQNITVALDASGTATISTSDIDNGSTDNCSIVNMALDVMQLDCSNLGANTVTLTAMDVDGNIHTAPAVVTVEDNTAPTVITQDITISLDAFNTASITTMDINNGSTDNCGIENMTLDIMQFDCSTVGMNTVTLTVMDVNGNVQTGTAVVTVEDNSTPSITTMNPTVSLDAQGMATITATDVVTVTSNCNSGPTSTINLGTTQFDCSNLGMNSVSIEVIDAAGNTETATAMVTVEDNTAPTVITQDITISLDAFNTASITTMDINNGSADNCGIESMTLNIMQFDCSTVGMNTVTLTVMDVNGNVQTGTAVVTVEDNSTPTITTLNPTIYLDAQGMATITADDVVTVTSNCNSGPTSTINLGLTEFDCSNLGMNLVSVEVIDAAGNATVSSSLVTVADTIDAVITCSVPLTAFACDSTMVVDYDTPTVTDNCDVTGAPVLVSGLASGSEFPVGTTTNTYSYTDANDNTVTCSFDIVIFQGTIDIMLDTVQNVITGNDGAISITVTGANPLTYEWFLNGMVVSTEEDPTGLMAGNYEVIVTDVNGCTQSMMVVVDMIEAINNPDVLKNIKVFPNPTAEQLFVNIDLPTLENTEIQLFNLDGKLLLNKISASQNQIELNVSNFANGIYILKLTIDNEIVTKRVTVSH